MIEIVQISMYNTPHAPWKQFQNIGNIPEPWKIIKTFENLFQPVIDK